KENSPVIGLYSEYESDHNGEYTLIVGAEVNETEEDNFTFGKIVKGEYLSFNIKGDFPQAIIQGWTDIYRYFENNKKVERTFTSDFEEYLSENELNINIAIKSR
ncbi:MAG: GyrI-like domain-containing protein, partial [Rhodothermaceae bacterium]